MSAVRVRLAAIAAVGAVLALALGVRALSGREVVDSSGALAQYSGTALYAAMMYAAIFVLAPRTRPVVAALAAIGFCWVVELFQLTGVPAELSARSLFARLALGVEFDPADLLWYVIGVVPPVAIHQLTILRKRP
jgi:hypothetical protein